MLYMDIHISFTTVAVGCGNGGAVGFGGEICRVSCGGCARFSFMYVLIGFNGEIILFILMLLFCSRHLGPYAFICRNRRNHAACHKAILQICDVCPFIRQWLKNHDFSVLPCDCTAARFWDFWLSLKTERFSWR